MRRQVMSPRSNWQAIVESQGLHFHSIDDQPYWDESACYVFRESEIDRIERATLALDQMCLEAVQHVIDRQLWDLFEIPKFFRDWLRQSWDLDEHTIYGRFDFALPADGVPRLLEFNADTPTALLEAAVVQWHWLQDVAPERDQFNSLHERLIEAWRRLRDATCGTLHFASTGEHLEDFMTVGYLRDTAQQAGWETDYLAIELVAWNPQRQQFVDGGEREIRTIFKLYPWEWMLREEFGRNLLACKTRWLEPPWKILLSNKAILPILWRLFPDSPYLLRADFEPWSKTYVRKAKQGREGANISLVHNGRAVLETDGPYTGPAIYQEVCALPEFDGAFPVLGSWLVNGHACGLGVREDDQAITQNTSRFVPHYIES